MSRVERFWSRVSRQESGCWLWTGWRDRDGYGRLKWRGRKIRAHRLAYELHNGPVASTLQVCHSCDVPACVNPAHLWVGTNRDNVADSIAKDRWTTGDRNGSRTKPASRPRGARHYNARLTPTDVQAIRAAAAAGAPKRELAEHYGLVLSHVYRIVKGEKWRSIQ